jgi:hypothetical protein
LPYLLGIWTEPIMAQLLLFDNDPVLISKQVRQAIPPPRYRVETAGTGAEGNQSRQRRTA